MRALLFAALLGGCVTPAATFTCDDPGDCPGGRCEVDGFCSFPDSSCASGSRYGDGSGELSNACVAATAICGNDMVEVGEDCEDGNSDATDFCIDCKAASCGDGQVQLGVEECDDQNADEADGCNNNCLMCPAGAVTNPDNGHCYWAVEAPDDWSDAAAACTVDRGYMVSIGDAAEHAFVLSRLGPAAQYWIGLEETFLPGGGRDFRWEDDKRLGTGFSSWATNEPSTGVDDECVGMVAAGTWDAQLCGTQLPYVCERERPVVDVATRRIFHLFPGEQQRTYDAAKTLCASLPKPGHLVTIADQAEQDFVNALMDSSRFWLGLDDLTTEGTFVWVTGEPTGFFNWDPVGGFDNHGPEPDAVDASFEDMVGLAEDGFWETRDASDDENVICEIDP